MTAPPGQEVGLYVDLVAEVKPGDVIETQSGRRYGVERVRVQTRGIHKGRQHLRAIVLDSINTEIPSTSTIHLIRWYARTGGKLQRRRAL